MATFTPTMNARPMVWRTSTNGNAQIVIASRSQTLSHDPSIQRKKGSMRDEYYPHKSVYNAAQPRKDERVTVVMGLGFGISGGWNRRSHADSANSVIRFH